VLDLLSVTEQRLMCSISIVVTNLDRLDKIVVTRLGYLGEYRPGCCAVAISLTIAYINMNPVAPRARQLFPPRPSTPLFSFRNVCTAT
jgi:hypothetical protein